MKNLLLILNPIAGTKKATKHLSQIISIFNRADYDVHVHVTSCKSDATNAVRMLGENADIIVCCGGDGTLNETITGVIEKDLNVPIGYIPSGSTNDFANSFSLPTDVLEAATRVVEGTPTPCDVGKFGEKHFSYVASFGTFTKASYNTPQSIKNALGNVAYIFEGIQELPSVHKEHIKMEVDGEVIENDYIFGAICNSTSIGGILTLKSDVVDMADGEFEIFLVKSPKDIHELGECIYALASKKYDCKMITLRKGKNIKVYSNPDMVWSLDGERTEGSECVEIQNLYKRVNIIC